MNIAKLLCKIGIHDYDEIKREKDTCGRCEMEGENPELTIITYKCNYCGDTFRRSYHSGYKNPKNIPISIDAERKV